MGELKARKPLVCESSYGCIPPPSSLTLSAASQPDRSVYLTGVRADLSGSKGTKFPIAGNE
ncbi:MAG: hypothetical protein LBL04_10320 [Bacteroidales bacterium]|nr:hypothetical protein [Bacteroidales bacterium]